MSNPTRDALQKCLASLEGSKYAMAYPSGCAALSAILHLLKSGDHILASDEEYGGSRLILIDYVKIQGIELDFVDTTDIKQVEKVLKPNTKVRFLEFQIFSMQ